MVQEVRLISECFQGANEVLDFSAGVPFVKNWANFMSARGTLGPELKELAIASKKGYLQNSCKILGVMKEMVAEGEVKTASQEGCENDWSAEWIERQVS